MNIFSYENSCDNKINRKTNSHLILNLPDR